MSQALGERNHPLAHRLARKHLQINMSLEPGPRELVLCVQDDGNGVDLVRERDGQPEIHIMGYRASIIGARLSIGPAEGGGILVRSEVLLLVLEQTP